MGTDARLWCHCLESEIRVKGDIKEAATSLMFLCVSIITMNPSKNQELFKAY